MISKKQKNIVLAIVDIIFFAIAISLQLALVNFYSKRGQTSDVIRCSIWVLLGLLILFSSCRRYKYYKYFFNEKTYVSEIDISSSDFYKLSRLMSGDFGCVDGDDKLNEEFSEYVHKNGSNVIYHFTFDYENGSSVNVYAVYDSVIETRFTVNSKLRKQKRNKGFRLSEENKYDAGEITYIYKFNIKED